MFATVKKISVCFFTTLMLISFFSFNVSASSIETSAESFTAPAGVTLTYRSRARKKKWEKYKKQGWISGVAAKKKRKLDAVSIKIKSSTPGTIKYRVHAYRKGWTAYKTNGKTAGRRGYGGFSSLTGILRGEVADLRGSQRDSFRSAQDRPSGTYRRGGVQTRL